MLSPVQKTVILFFGLSLSPHTLFAKNLFSEKRLYRLSEKPQWKRVLHFKNGVSEIDDPKFFFSKEGKYNPTAELKASIEQLLSDKSDDENSTLCYYPSRSEWILEQLPELKKHLKLPQCKRLKEELKKLGAKEVTLILASAHMNSPASAFGHTFLRIDNNPDTPLLSYAVNYAAQTMEDNGFIYAYQGLFGGYKGRYSIEPYYKKLKEYSDLEQRDVWEYTLDLSEEEIERLVKHIFEIRHFYADYFFLNENCSYNLLWLIEIAKKRTVLVHKFNHKAIPIDTLRAVISEKLVKKSTYRPSKRREILRLSEPIADNAVALAFAQSEEYNLSLIEPLTQREKIASLELATALLKIKRSNRRVSQKEYLEKFLKILKKRSTLGKIERTPTPQPPPPQEGHLSAKTTFTALGNKDLELRTKISYHDIYDNDSGYLSGAYISFFDTAIEYKERQLQLKEINLLEIKSYAIQDAIFKPISWEVSVGAKRVLNNQLYSYLRAGAGVTLGNNNFYGYTTLTPTLYYKKESQKSLSLNSGLFYNPSKYLKIGVNGSKEWFKKSETTETIEPFITYSFNQETALNIKYNRKTSQQFKEREVSLSWFWYY